VLSRRGKNNPVLIGDAGVGKTAIVEGLAQRIADGDVPDVLLGRRVVALLQDLEDLLGRRVDVVEPEGLHWYIRDRVLKEAVPL
jgi:ATP-dependent Clp protease ATP-binding subunit ClpA